MAFHLRSLLSAVKPLAQLVPGVGTAYALGESFFGAQAVSQAYQTGGYGGGGGAPSIGGKGVTPGGGAPTVQLPRSAPRKPTGPSPGRLAGPGMGTSLLGMVDQLRGAGQSGSISTKTGFKGALLPNGQFVRAHDVAMMARRLGLDATAQALGISATDAASAVISDSKRAARRRTRGISGRDIRITRRTMHKFRSLAHALGRGGGVRHRSVSRPARTIRS